MSLRRTIGLLAGAGLVLTVTYTTPISAQQVKAKAVRTTAAPLDPSKTTEPTSMSSFGNPEDVGAEANIERGWKRPDGAKDLSRNVTKGLSWLIENQLPNGAWGQGEESRQMGRSMAEYVDKGNLADTAIAALAIMRAGSTPSDGPHHKSVSKALDYMFGEIEESDRDSLYVTNVRGTRVQSKIGPYVDTFLSSLVLSEAKGKMPSKREELRLARALDKVLSKIERNQRKDGGFEGQAWAPVLSQAIAAKGVNRAAQAGVAVDDGVREKLEKNAQAAYDGKSGEFRGGGSAGVSLYAAAAATGALSDSVSSNDLEEADVRVQAESAPTEYARKTARDKLRRFDEVKRSRTSAQGTLVDRLDDPSFVAGFGNNGGEEFLSYMLVSETLVQEGGEKWDDWDKAMSKNLNRVQNGDGSWSGHHCITGRTFVTSTALLVLTADRAPIPVASKLRGN